MSSWSLLPVIRCSSSGSFTMASVKPTAMNVTPSSRAISAWGPTSSLSLLEGASVITTATVDDPDGMDPSRSSLKLRSAAAVLVVDPRCRRLRMAADNSLMLSKSSKSIFTELVLQKDYKPIHIIMF